jgi:hypothetical protein
VIVYTPTDPVTGRARQVSATAHSKREAEAVLNRLLAEVGAGRHSGPDVTMAELLEQWFAVASPDWSSKTVVETRRFIDNYVVPHLGRVKVRKLTTAQLDGFYGMLKKRGGRAGRPLSVASVRGVHVVVRGRSRKPSGGAGCRRTWLPTHRQDGSPGVRSHLPIPK